MEKVSEEIGRECSEIVSKGIDLKEGEKKGSALSGDDRRRRKLEEIEVEKNLAEVAPPFSVKQEWRLFAEVGMLGLDI